ncbi:glycosyltransferase [Spirulina sp. CS-785/01]|uniref:glycosyltransferase n=1 Tax=Spirulina sp. CS-785/01 TaxID=3021716 RepID=UPI0023310406|nr:glycosyltransferase [Spirulina sp. CS-785/01]MDB9315089.1 glycosyltransferase [Spirulina sp. CS-785/01]
MMENRFFLLFSNIFGFKGGIQVYSLHLLNTLQHFYPEAHYEIFLKYDRHAVQTPQTHYHCLGKKPRWLQSLLLALYPLLRAIFHRPTLLITTHLNYGIAGYLLKRLLGVPYWVVVHGLEGWDLTHPLRVKALEQADRVIAVSDYTKSRLLQEQNLNPQQVTVLPNTFDHHSFKPAPKPQYLLNRYNLTPDQPILLTVTRLGRSATYKGYDQILHALVTLRKQIPNLHYLLVGKGDDTPRIQALIEQLHLQDCVTLTGFVPDEELCNYYNLCDVFALPSKGEGFGIVYLEALACGKPILAGNQDGSVDPLLHGKLGCLVHPDDLNSITHNLQQLLQRTHPNPILFQPEALRQAAIEHFGLPQFKNTLKTLISKQRLKGRGEKTEGRRV